MYKLGGSSNGRTLGFGPKNWGSSPYPGTLGSNSSLAVSVNAVSWPTETGRKPPKRAVFVFSKNIVSWQLVDNFRIKDYNEVVNQFYGYQQSDI